MKLWAPNKIKQLEKLGFVYDEKSELFFKRLKYNDEFIRATTNHLSWYNASAFNDGQVLETQKFGLDEFEKLLGFLKTRQK